MHVLITGGAGFVGSTVANACLDAGITPVLLDDLSAGRREFATAHHFYEGDIGDPRLLDGIFDQHPGIAAVVHCAARVVASESVTDPIPYYETNVAGTLRLAAHMIERGCLRLVFSSSAAIYAASTEMIVDEASPLAPCSPYARTKAMAEQILADVAAASPLRVLALRYFNPIGADPQLRTGPYGDPSHVLGQLISTFRERRPFILTGTEWPTDDGSAIRDYIHVWDLARAHVHALQRFDDVTATNAYQAVDLGTGNGTTVRELVAAFRAIVGGAAEVIEGLPRPGDVAGSYTRSARARQLLNWTADKSLEDAIRDALAWQEQRSANPTASILD